MATTPQQLFDLEQGLSDEERAIRRTAPVCNDGRMTPQQASVRKLKNVREALRRITRECRTVLGAAGITLEYPIMRHANNLESILTYEGTSEVPHRTLAFR